MNREYVGVQSVKIKLVTQELHFFKSKYTQLFEQAKQIKIFFYV